MNKESNLYRFKVQHVYSRQLYVTKDTDIKYVDTIYTFKMQPINNQ